MYFIFTEVWPQKLIIFILLRLIETSGQNNGGSSIKTDWKSRISSQKSHWKSYINQSFCYLLLLVWSGPVMFHFFKEQPFSYENHSECYKKLASRSWPMLFTLFFFSYTYTPLFCWEIKSCCGHCFPQQIRPLFNDHRPFFNDIHYKIILVSRLLSIWLTNTAHWL